MPRHLALRVRPAVPPRRFAWGTAAVMLAAALTACTPGSPDDTPTATATATAPQPSTGATPAPTAPAEPTLVPDGTASDNQPLFAAVTAAVWATENRVAGRAYIDALTAAGFDKGAMQVTDDETTVGNAAESIQFSVRWGDECLIGQVGPATGEPVTAVVPVLAEGTCLVGETRPIDW
ncbi:MULTISPECIES: hypothetical protein [Microbacterium]|uniref:DUF6993 domain-containing protein n=1 Tax=Microbacterium TaxID=33882 RepID=UPI0030D96EC8